MRHGPTAGHPQLVNNKELDIPQQPPHHHDANDHKDFEAVPTPTPANPANQPSAGPESNRPL